MRALRAIGFVVAVPLFGCGDEPPPYTPDYYMRRYGPRAVAYRLPVRGTWVVIRTHYKSEHDQRWAIDLGILDGDRKRFDGDGNENSDYHAYNQPIVADAPGVIAVVVDGVPENEPGKANRYDLHGNYVVIDHENGEFSLMCHFIPRSIPVRVGQRVKAGDEIGRCGNSGFSGEPHLHWQVMDHLHAYLARPVQPRYAPYLRNGKPSTAPPEGSDLVASD